MKIDKGVPIPPKRTGRFKGLTETVRRLQLGDSVLLKGAHIGNITSMIARVDGKFTCRTQPGGVRIWRVE